jgi:hypothetical protein
MEQHFDKEVDNDGSIMQLATPMSVIRVRTSSLTRRKTVPPQLILTREDTAISKSERPNKKQKLKCKPWSQWSIST